MYIIPSIASRSTMPGFLGLLFLPAARKISQPEDMEIVNPTSPNTLVIHAKNNNRRFPMTGLDLLWFPILLSSVFVFIASSIIHMASPWHKTDYPKMLNEDKVMDALRPLTIPPGDYMIPRPSSRQEMRSPEFIEKMKKGPVMMLTVWPAGPMSMWKNLVMWFLYAVVVGIFAAYVAGRALPAGAAYLQVFRFAGVTAFLAYSLALWQMSIWYHRSWTTTIKITADGLIYALLTAGTFGWLWPH